MEMAGVTADQIDLIIVASITPDMPFPNTACLVQQKIGARRIPAFDIEAACSGFLYALEVGQNFIAARTFETVLVIGAEKLSAITNWKDRNTCVLFGDGAGAAILQSRPLPRPAHHRAGRGWHQGGVALHARRRQPPPGPARRWPTACISCAWTARKPSRTPCRRCAAPPRKSWPAAKLISPDQVRHPAPGQPPHH